MCVLHLRGMACLCPLDCLPPNIPRVVEGSCWSQYFGKVKQVLPPRHQSFYFRVHFLLQFSSLRPLTANSKLVSDGWGPLFSMDSRDPESGGIWKAHLCLFTFVTWSFLPQPPHPSGDYQVLECTPAVTWRLLRHTPAPFFTVVSVYTVVSPVLSVQPCFLERSFFPWQASLNTGENNVARHGILNPI